MSNYERDLKIRKLVMDEIEKCYSNTKSDIRYHKYGQTPGEFDGRIARLTECINNVRDQLSSIYFSTRR